MKILIRVVGSAYLTKVFRRLNSKRIEHSQALGVDQASLMLISFSLGVCLPLMQATLFRLYPLYVICIIVAVLSLVKVWHSPIAKYTLALLVGLTFATHVFQQQTQQSLDSEFERVSIAVSGKIVGLPNLQNDNSRFRFYVDSAPPKTQLQGSFIQLSCYRCSLNFEPNQRWQFSVRLKQPHGYASWGAFDYEKFLFRHQVVARGYIRLKEENRYLGSSADGFNNVRWRLRQKLAALDKSGSVGVGVIAALTIGDKSMLDSEQRAVFQGTGVSHLMAISGLHIGLVFLFVRFLFSWASLPFARVYEFLPRQHLALLPALASAFCYSALAGFAVSTQRALIMLCVFVACRLLARDIGLLKVLLLAASLVLLLDPFSILDVGFWLSCGAVFVIALIVRDQQKPSLLSLQPKLWVGMLPLTSLFFGQVSLVSPLVNLIMVPLFCTVLIPFTLVATALLQVGAPLIAEPLLILLSVIFEWLYNILARVHGFPLARWYTIGWTSLHWSLFLLILASHAIVKPHVALFGARITIWLCLIASLFLSPTDYLDRGFGRVELEVVLLDVGQGLAMVIQYADYVLIYDSGPRYSSGFTAADAVILPYLRSKGIRRIDRLIISHADNDHIGGYQTIMAEFEVGDVLSSRVDKLPFAKRCVAGQQWSVSDVRFEIISPDSDTPEGGNNRSCVLRIDYAQSSVLITGDIEKQAEAYLVRKSANIDVDIMVVPHHGSKTSSIESFIDAVNPSVSLVTAGYLNRYGHPHATVVKRYSMRRIDLVSSIENGSILLKINKQGWRRESFRVAQRGFWHHQKKPNWD